MSMYESPPDGHVSGNGMHELELGKAPQACMSCRKQKRKCSKTLPACALCERMNRHCDYSNAAPPPSSEDFNALRQKLMELESRLNGGGMNPQMSPYATPSSTTLATSDNLGPPVPAFTPPQDAPWQGIQNRFPAIAFLDSDNFKYGGIVVPKPSLEIPVDVLELLGDAATIQATISEYFATIHMWMPIFSQKRLTRNMVNPLWEAGPDLALLFLCMKLITSRPQDGIESSQHPIYVSAKRFIALLEATGAATLLMLQANILVAWYEYGQAIYPAAYMTAGWCVRYGNMLGISGSKHATDLLGRPGTWTEQEERMRTWWGVLIVNRIVSLGSQSYVLNSQEPKSDDPLPVNDSAWEAGEMTAARRAAVGSSISEPVTSFPRLCQAMTMMGKVFSHHYGDEFASEADQFKAASELYAAASALARKIPEEADAEQDFFSYASATALTYSTLCNLCEVYSCPKGNRKSTGKESSEMQIQAIEGLKTVSGTIVNFVDHINANTPLSQELDRISPIIMDALYSAAANYAWMVRESGDEVYQNALDAIRLCLRKLGTRWRNAAEYVRILEAQEFSYAVGSAS
ncbi:hypothetical protein BGZ57DRAFT_869998 [Hyaloscypha finlandica]|nr:hypothetical protein BGZ57DRAFT_869998 [Hyaloscypha finlandica]KAH8801016.1 hypothetical protein F5882DRAFT_393588 [Hyaloscypha sp. PMI_1271]